jgi:hypothetical protein
VTILDSLILRRIKADLPFSATGNYVNILLLLTSMGKKLKIRTRLCCWMCDCLLVVVGWLIGLHRLGRFPPMGRDSIWVIRKVWLFIQFETVLFFVIFLPCLLPNPSAAARGVLVVVKGRWGVVFKRLKATVKFDYLVSCSPTTVKRTTLLCFLNFIVVPHFLTTIYRCKAFTRNTFFPSVRI